VHGVPARLALVALLPVLGCGRDDPRAQAMVIESLVQAPGGPKATAEVGDFLLKNDEISAVIEQGGRSSASLDVGGMLVDLDLNRQQSEYRAGRGLDQLGQIGQQTSQPVQQ